MVEEETDWDAYYEELDKKEAEQSRFGFKSKVTEMAEGRSNVDGTNTKKKKQKKFNVKRLMHPSKKPPRFVPKPIDVSVEHAKRGGLIGIPEGVDGFRPIRFFQSDNEPKERDMLFGVKKRDSKGRVKLF